MEPTRSSNSPDSSGQSGKRNVPPAASRLTVQSLEEAMRRRSGEGRSSGSNMRRSRRRMEDNSGRLVWFAVAIIAVLYLGFLAFQTVRPKIHKKPAVKTASTSAKTIAATGAPAAIAKSPADGEAEESVSDLPAAAAMIAGIKKSQQLAEEARRFVRSKQWALANAKFEESVRLSPHVFSILMEWADVLREQKRWSAARDVLVRALAVSPDSSAARLALAQVYHQLLQTDDALAIAMWIIEAEPYSEAAHQIAADVYTAKEQHAQAITHWQRLVALNSNNHIAENNLGAAYLKLGQTAQALKTFENVLRDEPNNSQAHYFMALCFIQKNEPDLAVDVLVRAAARFGQKFVYAWTRSPDFDSIRDLPSFRVVFAESLLAEAAMPVGTDIAQVFKDNPENSQNHYYMAIYFMKENEPELAVDILTRAAERFGKPFVMAWTQSEEFAGLRELPAYQAIFEDMAPTALPSP